MRRSRAEAASLSRDFGARRRSVWATDRVAEHPGRLLSELDGRPIFGPAGKWTIEVFSISKHGGYVWLQLTLKGHPNHVLTLKLGRAQGVPQVLDALASWLRHPLTTGEVVNVGVPAASGKHRQPN